MTLSASTTRQSRRIRASGSQSCLSIVTLRSLSMHSNKARDVSNGWTARAAISLARVSMPVGHRRRAKTGCGSARPDVESSRLETADKDLPTLVGVSEAPADVVSDRLPHHPKPALGFPRCFTVAVEKVDQYEYGIIRGRLAGQPHSLRRGRHTRR